MKKNYIIVLILIVIIAVTFIIFKFMPSQYIKPGGKLEIPISETETMTVEGGAGFAFLESRGIEQCDELLNTDGVRFYNYCVGNVAAVSGDMNICYLQNLEGLNLYDSNMTDLAKQERLEKDIDHCIKNVYRYSANWKKYNLLGLCAAQDTVIKKADCYRAFRDSEIYQSCTEKYALDFSDDAADKWKKCIKEYDTICPQLIDSDERDICENAYELYFYDSDEDGLNDQEEETLGTSATMADTDGDGYEDKTEIDNGYDPLTP